MFRPGRQQRADAAHGRPDERRLALLQRPDFFQQHPGRHPLQQDRGGLLIAYPGGQRHNARRRPGIVRRISAAPGIGDPVARLDMHHALADLLNHACTFRPRNKRQRHPVEARAVIGVNEVHPHRRLTHQHLARSRRARRRSFYLQDLWPAGLMHANGVGVWKGHCSGSRKLRRPLLEEGRYALPVVGRLEAGRQRRHVRLHMLRQLAREAFIDQRLHMPDREGR